MKTGQEVKQDVQSKNEARYTPERELVSWNALSRPFKKRTREYWVTVVAIASLLSFIMFLAEGVMPVILIISVIFLFYVLSTVEPHEISYKITNKGVKIADALTEWEKFTQYWFSERMGERILNFALVSFPGRLELVVHDQDVENLRRVLGKYLPEEMPPKTSLEKASDIVSRRFLDN